MSRSISDHSLIINCHSFTATKSETSAGEINDGLIAVDMIGSLVEDPVDEELARLRG